MRKNNLHPNIRSRRGTAEVELLLSIVILLMTLFLALGAGKIARLRLQTTDTAHTDAVRDATAASTPTDAADSTVNPIDSSLVDPLPNRNHTPSSSGSLDLIQPNGRALTSLTLAAKSETMSPAWTYTAYPFESTDANATKTWYGNHVGDYHAPLETPFQLVPAWTP